MDKILKFYNPLQYPGGMPGFNPSHPASKNIGFSLVPMGASVVDLITCKKANQVPGGNPTYQVLSGLGPSAQVLSNGTPELWYAGGSFVSGKTAPFTLAAIVQFVAVGNLQYFLHNDSRQATTVNNGGRIGIYNATLQPNSFFLATANFVVDPNNANFVAVANVPYFFAASYNGTTANMVLARLDNGRIFSQVVSSTLTVAASDGGAGILNYGSDGTDGGSFGIDGSLAAAMCNYSYMSIPQLLVWASDPWSFWFPRAQQNLMFIGLQAPQGAASPVVFRKTLSQIGGRVGSRQPQGWAA